MHMEDVFNIFFLINQLAFNQVLQLIYTLDYISSNLVYNLHIRQHNNIKQAKFKIV